MEEVKKYMKKPIPVEAIQFDGTLTCLDKIRKSFPSLRITSSSFHEGRDEAYNCRIETRKGQANLNKHDYIVKTDMEYYPLSAILFNAMYQELKS